MTLVLVPITQATPLSSISIGDVGMVDIDCHLSLIQEQFSMPLSKTQSFTSRSDDRNHVICYTNVKTMGRVTVP